MYANIETSKPFFKIPQPILMLTNTIGLAHTCHFIVPPRLNTITAAAAAEPLFHFYSASAAAAGQDGGAATSGISHLCSLPGLPDQGSRGEERGRPAGDPMVF